MHFCFFQLISQCLTKQYNKTVKVYQDLIGHSLTHTYDDYKPPTLYTLQYYFHRISHVVLWLRPCYSWICDPFQVCVYESNLGKWKTSSSTTSVISRQFHSEFESEFLKNPQVRMETVRLRYDFHCVIIVKASDSEAIKRSQWNVEPIMV